jgi:hypothetical protein
MLFFQVRMLRVLRLYAFVTFLLTLPRTFCSDGFIGAVFNQKRIVEVCCVYVSSK